MSHKRLNALFQLLQEIGHDKFRLNSIFDVRWVSSHHRAYLKLLDHWFELVQFFDDMMIKYLREFSKATTDEAGRLNDFLRNKFAVAMMQYYLDILDVLMSQSKIFQTSGSTIIGQESRKQNLVDGFTKIKNLKGFYFTRFLMTANCFDNLKDAQKFIDGRSNM